MPFLIGDIYLETTLPRISMIFVMFGWIIFTFGQRKPISKTAGDSWLRGRPYPMSSVNLRWKEKIARIHPSLSDYLPCNLIVMLAIPCCCFFLAPDVPSCQSDELQCASGHCIPENWICDGQNDCTNGSDESDCCKLIFTLY